MEIKFADIIRVKRGSCTKCLSFVYSTPCVIDKRITKHLINFGEPVYNINVVDLLRIETDQHIIEARIDKTKIKISMPKELEDTNWEKTTRKTEFEQALKSWIEEILEIRVI